MGIFIGGAWAYANGSLHLGHISSLLPGDILARYYRLKGEKVLYVSGSDCNGTPIMIRAKQESVSPKEIADRYHEEFQDCFTKLGFTYDIYARTDTSYHHRAVQEIFRTLLEKGLIYKKEPEQTFCQTCDQFLPDRYVEGTCPICNNKARGDQCDYCSAILDPLDLLDRFCRICKNPPATKYTEHFYFALSQLQSRLESYVADAKNNWRDNAYSISLRYLKEGLHDRAVTRDLPIGVSVPVKGYEEKKIYVWIEAISGYYSASKRWAHENNKDDSIFWQGKTRSYYVHGKDNIPFHSILWPAILVGIDCPALPAHIVSNEYLTLEKRKLSTSKNWAVWVPAMLESYHPDSIRYFLTINAPESRDADFSWREFIYSHNSELLGAYGNLVNRTIKFIVKYFDGIIPVAPLLRSHQADIQRLFVETSVFIEKAHFKNGLEGIFHYVRYANKYFDEQKPWKQVKEDIVLCKQTIANCVFLIINIAQLLSPYLPFSSYDVRKMIAFDPDHWGPVYVKNRTLGDVKPLFERIDLKQIEKELEKLQHQSKD